MKKILFAIAIWSLVLPQKALLAEGRSGIFIVNEIKTNMEHGLQKGQEIYIPEVELKEIKSAFVKWGKSNKAKINSSKRSPNIFMDNASLPTVSENTVDIYAEVIALREGVQIRTFVDLGGAFLAYNDHPKAFAAMEKILIDFARENLLKKAEANVKAEEKHLSKLRSELKSLERKKSSYERDIKRHTDNIYKKEQEIRRNEQNQTLKEQQIGIQQDIVETARQKATALGSNDPDAQQMLQKQVKKEEKDLSKFERELRKLQSRLKSAVSSIKKSKQIIAQREQDIIKNAEDRQTKTQQIDLQQKIVEMMRKKKEDIR